MIVDDILAVLRAKLPTVTVLDAHPDPLKPDQLPAINVLAVKARRKQMGNHDYWFDVHAEIVLGAIVSAAAPRTQLDDLVLAAHSAILSDLTVGAQLSAIPEIVTRYERHKGAGDVNLGVAQIEFTLQWQEQYLLDIDAVLERLNVTYDLPPHTPPVSFEVELPAEAPDIAPLDNLANVDRIAAYIAERPPQK